MKKLALLFSTLALASCSGGSGKKSTPAEPSIPPPPITMDITLVRENVYYSNHIAGFQSVVPSFVITAPVLGGTLATGAPSAPSLAGAPSSGTGATVVAAGVAATTPAQLLNYDANTPAVVGSFATAITGCTLEDIMVRPCTVAGSLFNVSIDPLDLVGLSDVELIVDGDVLQIPVKRIDIQKVADSCDISSDQWSHIAVLNDRSYYKAEAGTGSCATKLVRVDNDGNVAVVSNTRNDMTLGDVISNAIVHGSNLYFVAVNSNGMSKLFKMDSSEVITQITNSRNDQNLPDAPGNFVIFNGALYFKANNETNGVGKLHKLNPDDTYAQVSNTTGSDAVADQILIYGELSGELYFSSKNLNNATKLFKIDAAGVVTQVLNIMGDQTVNDIYGSIGQVFNGKLYMLIRVGGRDRLHSIDPVGTATMVTIMNAAANDSFSPILFNGEMYYNSNVSGIAKLFKMNSSGIVTQVSNHAPGSSDMITLNGAKVVNGSMYFSGAVSAGVTKLLRLGTDGVITQVTNTSGLQTDTDQISQTTFHGDNILFSAANSEGVYKLFKFDTLTDEVSEISNLSGDRTIGDIIGAGISATSTSLYVPVNIAGDLELIRVSEAP